MNFQPSSSLFLAQYCDDLLRREAALLRRISDVQGITHLLSTFESEDGCFHLLIDFCNAGSLHDRLIASRAKLITFSEEQVANIIHTLANTLVACHRQRVVHLDITPSNILFHINSSGAEEVKLTDFGMAEIIETGQMLYDRGGTPYYNSPEVIRGCYDHRADIWSLGVILHLLLTNTFPFFEHRQKSSITEVYNAILTEEIDIGAIRKEKELSAPVCDLLLRMLCKDADKRITLEEVLHHPWFEILHTGSGAPPSPIIRNSPRKVDVSVRPRRRVTEL
ncbi:hypothetical protein KP509_22G052900 [Ceratopteris richardii]|uniref:Protein kinase domain-containing protein n=1 Tax=Ceratopteris richardii TaxID=49495 RepID=A0A8T2S7X3_CERRI|nr:hypothetical protein KP509_22G052900 [Ceratopteris richardii]